MKTLPQLKQAPDFVRETWPLFIATELIDSAGNTTIEEQAKLVRSFASLQIHTDRFDSPFHSRHLTTPYEKGEENNPYDPPTSEG